MSKPMKAAKKASPKGSNAKSAVAKNATTKSKPRANEPPISTEKSPTVTGESILTSYPRTSAAPPPGFARGLVMAPPGCEGATHTMGNLKPGELTPDMTTLIQSIATRTLRDQLRLQFVPVEGSTAVHGDVVFLDLDSDNPEGKREARWFLKKLALDGVGAYQQALWAIIDRGEAAIPQKANKLSALGDIVSNAIKRTVLLDTLWRCSWNLTHTASALGLGSSGNVVRAIRELDLESALESARDQGLVTKAWKPAKK